LRRKTAVVVFESGGKPVPNNIIMETNDSRGRNGRHPIAYNNIIPKYTRIVYHGIASCNIIGEVYLSESVREEKIGSAAVGWGDASR